MAMSSQVIKGNYAAIAANDDDAISGYYVCCIRSTQYYLQQTYAHGNEMIPRGEWVCDVVWLNPIPSCRLIYTHGLKGDNSLHSLLLGCNMSYMPMLNTYIYKIAICCQTQW